MTTAITARTRTDRCTVALVVGIVDALVGLAGVLTTSGAVLVAAWVLLLVGIDVALVALWRSRTRTTA